MPESIVADYPESSGLTLDLRPQLHPVFRALKEGISEFTFANIYLFRATHNYRISRLNDGLLVISGEDNGGSFFMLPTGLPKKMAILRELFDRFSFMKNASEKQAKELLDSGLAAEEDRNNFDYLYLRAEMAALSGRRFHRKKNRVNFFLGKYSCVGKPLSEECLPDALRILDSWLKGRKSPGDYAAAKEALERCRELSLCGRIYYVEGKPAAYVLGEELNPETFVVHFEKGIGVYKGLLQFVNQSFAAVLPERYRFINREQDLGDAGLRKSKSSYMPCGFVKKFRVTRPGDRWGPTLLSS